MCLDYNFLSFLQSEDLLKILLAVSNNSAVAPEFVMKHIWRMAPGDFSKSP